VWIFEVDIDVPNLVNSREEGHSVIEEMTCVLDIERLLFLTYNN